MRVPRKYALPPGSIFHSMWRCIDGEMLLKSRIVKLMLLNSLFGFLKRAQGEVKVYAFCIMNNHIHKAGELLKDSLPFSAWLRSAFSSFAQKFNHYGKKYMSGAADSRRDSRALVSPDPHFRRRGPVGMDRSKTLVVEDQQALMRVMFYIDFNPVRAGLVDDPADWLFSSYRFYAFGEVNEWTQYLTPPDFYLALGRTPRQRQAAYRRLARIYFEEGRCPTAEEIEFSPAIGNGEFVRRRKRFQRRLNQLFRCNRYNKEVIDYVVFSVNRLFVRSLLHPPPLAPELPVQLAALAGRT